MLYDKRWEKPEIKADPFLLDNLIAWLEKQPEDQIYEFTDCGGCALAQYFKAHGFIEVNMGTNSFDHGVDFENETPLPHGWNDLVNPHRPRHGYNTFGALLSRARAFRSPQEGDGA